MRSVWMGSLVLLPVLIGWPARASDFPISVCPAISGTVLSESGIDGTFAEMKGLVTRENLVDYCRAKSDEQKANTAWSEGECLRKASGDLSSLKLRAFANCRIGIVAWTDGRRAFKLRLPAATTACSSSNAVLVEQFKRLCPTAAKMYELH